MSKDEETAYACCSMGIGRWCWIVWANEEDARAGAEPLATGYEKTGGAAEKKADAVAGPRSKRLPGKWASVFKRGGTARTKEAGKRDDPRSRLSRRAVAGAASSGPARLTFLYVASESARADSRGEVEVVKHRIIRQTSAKIYVDREPFREEEWQGSEGLNPDGPRTRALAVDREVLRRDGRFPHRGSYFYASEEKGVQGVHADLTSRNPWCAVLDVSFPCSAESIKAAYRRLAQEMHPDAGGDPVKFRAVEQAYRGALAYFSSPDEAAHPV